MDDIRALYQEVIIDHGRHPRNFCLVNPANREADGVNPLCGDKLHVSLRVIDGIIQAVGFTGSGCAISMASASLMTEALQGKTIAHADQLFEQFHTLLTGDVVADTTVLGKLAILQGVRTYPMRVKCATLAWHALHQALHEHNGIATTET